MLDRAPVKGKANDDDTTLKFRLMQEVRRLYPFVEKPSTSGIVMINYAVIGRRIKEKRELNHKTQAELAEAAGMSVTYISCIERSKKHISLEALVAISNELGVTVDNLLSGNQIHDPAPLRSDWEDIAQKLDETMDGWEQYLMER